MCLLFFKLVSRVYKERHKELNETVNKANKKVHRKSNETKNIVDSFNFLDFDPTNIKIGDSDTNIEFVLDQGEKTKTRKKMKVGPVHDYGEV